MWSRTRTHTAAHRYYTYNQYTGNSSYLQMQQPAYYQKTMGSNKYGWCVAFAVLRGHDSQTVRLVLTVLRL